MSRLALDDNSASLGGSIYIDAKLAPKATLLSGLSFGAQNTASRGDLSSNTSAAPPRWQRIVDVTAIVWTKRSPSCLYFAERCVTQFPLFTEKMMSIHLLSLHTSCVALCQTMIDHALFEYPSHS